MPEPAMDKLSTYERPLALRLGQGRGAAGTCQSGSGDQETCLSDGNSAIGSLACYSSGLSALPSCYSSGPSAVGECSASGTSAAGCGNSGNNAGVGG